VQLRLQRTELTVSSPIFRCLEREAADVLALLTLVKAQLAGLQAVLAGKRRMTNELLALAHAVHRKEVPKDWAKRLPPGRGVSADGWVADLVVKGAAFLDALRRDKPFALPLHINLGDLFSPGAFLTATRQEVARAKHIALDSLRLVATVGQGHGDFASQVVLEGAKERSRTVLACVFTWTDKPPQALLRLPLYTDSARTHLITEVLFAGQVGDNSVMRGVALVAHLAH
jgi:hypothetical protein